MDTFKDEKYHLLAVMIMAVYGFMLLFFDSFLFLSPYFTLYIPLSKASNFVLDLILTALTAVVLTASVRQLLLQRGSRGVSGAGMLGIIAALLAGACPCYYLIPLLAVAGTVGGTLGAVGIALNNFQIPIKLVATLILLIATYKLNKSGICKLTPSSGGIIRKQTAHPN